MIDHLDMEDRDLALRAYWLLRQAYVVEARILGRQDLPPLRERFEQFRGSMDRFLGYCEDGEPVGVLSYRPEYRTVEITRLAVSPAAMRRGIATALLRELEVFAEGARELKVTAAEGNRPALALYGRSGYRPTACVMSNDGLRLVVLRKQMPVIAASHH